MGILSFIKSAGHKVLGGIKTAGKYLGQHIAPAVSGVANAVSKVAPYIAGGAGALGLPEVASLATGAGAIAKKVKGYADEFSKSKFGGGGG